VRVNLKKKQTRRQKLKKTDAQAKAEKKQTRRQKLKKIRRAGKS